MKYKVIILIGILVITIFAMCYLNQNENIEKKDSYDGTTSTQINESITDMTDTVQKVLADKGWVNIRKVKGLPDTSKYGGVIIELPYEGENIYTVIGETNGMYDNKITAISIVFFDDKTPKGRLEKVIYLSESGRDMFMEDIIGVHDKELWEYMYSY